MEATVLFLSSLLSHYHRLHAPERLHRLRTAATPERDAQCRQVVAPLPLELLQVRSAGRWRAVLAELGLDVGIAEIAMRRR